MPEKRPEKCPKKGPNLWNRLFPGAVIDVEAVVLADYDADVAGGPALEAVRGAQDEPLVDDGATAPNEPW